MLKRYLDTFLNLRRIAEYHIDNRLPKRKAIPRTHGVFIPGRYHL